MRPHPLFADREIPARQPLGPFVLTMLALDDLDEDFAAVTASEAALTGLMGGDWPAGLTLEDNRLDLAWHQREFIARRSFAWVIRDGAGAYLGCAYVSPHWTPLDAADAVYWFRTGAEAHAPAFRTPWRAWLDGPDWPRLALTHKSYPD
ncbi:MAG: hypothetical protein AAFR52_01535 [Pseudomonadota bacterium]